MENEEIRKLFEELDGKVELGIGVEALAICETILGEAEEIGINEFGDLCRAVGMARAIGRPLFGVRRMGG